MKRIHWRNVGVAAASFLGMLAASTWPPLQPYHAVLDGLLAVINFALQPTVKPAEGS